MIPPDISRTDLTGGEARVLAGQLAGLAAEEVAAWVLAVQTPGGDVAVCSSMGIGHADVPEAEFMTLAMLADAARAMAISMADRADGDG